MTDTNDLLTDDEALRERAMADGPRQVRSWTLRPMTALSVSWCQRNDIFGQGKDMIYQVAAFVLLHTEPLPRIRGIVNKPDLFAEAVDAWIEKNLTHHIELPELTRAMNEAYQLYMASASTADIPASAAGN